MTVLVTGATGLIGRRICEDLANRGLHVRGTHRSTQPEPHTNVVHVHLELESEIDSRLFEGVHTVIHCAAIADRRSGRSADFEQINTDATRRLAEAAARSGVGHFIFPSSLFVHGDVSDEPLRVNSPLRPVDAYARSKLLAETAIAPLRSEMRITILRLPLVLAEATPRSAVATKIARLPIVPVPTAPNRRAYIDRDRLVSDLAALVDEGSGGPSSIRIPDPTGHVGFEDTVRRAALDTGASPKFLRVPPSAFRIVHAALRATTGRSIAGIHADLDAEASTQVMGPDFEVGAPQPVRHLRWLLSRPR